MLRSLPLEIFAIAGYQVMQDPRQDVNRNPWTYYAVTINLNVFNIHKEAILVKQAEEKRLKAGMNSRCHSAMILFPA